jgi:hypothetical protein
MLCVPVGKQEFPASIHSIATLFDQIFKVYRFQRWKNGKHFTVEINHASQFSVFNGDSICIPQTALNKVKK